MFKKVDKKNSNYGDFILEIQDAINFININVS